MGLNHLPSGRFPANAAWLAVQVIAHNLARWPARIGLGEPVAITKTRRRRFFSLAGRITRKARRLTLHLPQGWPWQNQFSSALAQLRGPAPTFLTASTAFVRPPNYPTASRTCARPVSPCLLSQRVRLSLPSPSPQRVTNPCTTSTHSAPVLVLAQATARVA